MRSGTAMRENLPGTSLNSDPNLEFFILSSRPHLVRTAPVGLELQGRKYPAYDPAAGVDRLWLEVVLTGTDKSCELESYAVVMPALVMLFL